MLEIERILFIAGRVHILHDDDCLWRSKITDMLVRSRRILQSLLIRPALHSIDAVCILFHFPNVGMFGSSGDPRKA